MRPRLSRPFALTATLLTLSAAAAVALAQQYIPPHDRYPIKSPDDPYDFNDRYDLIIPAETYSAIVISAGNNKSGSSVLFNIRANNGDFPFYIKPGTTQIIPFEGGWTLRENARMAGSEDQYFTAWGITAKGPIAFIVPKKRGE